MSSSLFFGFTTLLRCSFCLCQRFSIGLQSGNSGGIRHQYYSLFTKVLLSSSRHMFQIIILGKSVPTRVQCFNHGNQGLLQEVNVSHSIHAAFKNANSRSPFLAYGRPHMDLGWVLRSRFVPWFKARFGAAESPMGLYLHSCLI